MENLIFKTQENRIVKILDKYLGNRKVVIYGFGDNFKRVRKIIENYKDNIYGFTVDRDEMDIISKDYIKKTLEN